MTFTPRPRAARLVLLVLPSVITLAALSGTAAVALALQERVIRDATADRVLEVASSLADLREVRDTVASTTALGSAESPADAGDLADATAVLQPIADLVEQAAGVYYVVITDDEGVRITHPSSSERGVRVETANETVLAGQTFLGTEVGASGPSLRAKVPVRASGGDVVGMVAVGVLESSIASEREAALGQLLPWTVGALVVATLASSALTAIVERRFRRLDVIAAEHAQMRRTTTALREQSHEFRTRLHVIHGLVARGDADEALSYIDDVVPVRTSGSEVSDGGAAGSSNGTGELGPVAAAMIQTVQGELVEWGARARFDVELDEDIDEGVVSVVANLCRNAGEAGAVSVRCMLADRHGRLIGIVEDDGPGIDPRIAARVFTPGFTTKHDATGWGRGLGLDVVRRVVTSRGGTIEVSSSPLGGARFSFEIERRR